MSEDYMVGQRQLVNHQIETPMELDEITLIGITL